MEIKSINDIIIVKDGDDICGYDDNYWISSKQWDSSLILIFPAVCNIHMINLWKTEVDDEIIKNFGEERKCTKHKYIL